ncbi:MAG TPA: T9SS type A sorting domain-containing protein [Bacteroides sp.]|nr:T9SS type A sorting domain-containing protein [Bacteroides sp.]
MYRLAVYIFLVVNAIPAAAQLLLPCPAVVVDMGEYRNPLDDRWLSAYDVKFYHLTLRVTNESTRIGGSAVILAEAVKELDTLVVELQDSLEVTGVEIADGGELDDFRFRAAYTHRENAVYVALDRTRLPGEQFAVKISYGGVAGRNRGFFAGITSATDSEYGFRVTYTLSEPLNARDWFPVKQVLGDKIDSVRMDLICGDHLMAASNGILLGVEELPGNERLFRWRTNYPMAFYLLFFAVAEYRDFTFRAPLSSAGDSVPVQNYVYDSDQLLADWTAEIRETGRLIHTYSTLLGDYPFAAEKYGHAMAPLGGGMEHQTMTTIQDFDFYLVAHELAHQWFGDHVTCGYWQDIWINEGFASYMEYVAAQQIFGQQAADEWMSHAMSLALGETSGSVYVPENRADDPFRLFDTGLSYKKGAILLHMIRYILDQDSLFFQVLRTYLDRFGNGLATGEDFRSVLEAESGMDFSCFFEQWYYGEGYPLYQITWRHDGDTLFLRSEQSGTSPATPLFTIPFDVDLLLSDGSAVRKKFFQDQAVEHFKVPLKGLVRNLEFDPDNDLLNTASVIRYTPSGGSFIFGPNPVNDQLYVELFNRGPIREIVIYSYSGQVVYRLSDAPNPVTLDLRPLADGPYLLVLYDETRTLMERIVKISE